MKKTYDKYYATNRSDVMKVGGDLKMLAWYSALKDYAKRFKKDKLGFIRVPSYVLAEDFSTNRTQIWRYNRMLEDKGLIEVDRVHRGGHTWVGFKLI